MARQTTRTDRSLAGARIRQRRRELGMTQVDLARRIGVSPSYLNLIEWNKRNISAALVQEIAAALETSVSGIESAGELQLQETLSEIARRPNLADFEIETAQAGQFVGRFPGWARGFAALARLEQDALARARSASTRLANDPFIAEYAHRILTRIAAVRSSADILTEYPDLPDERRERFVRIIHEEGEALTQISEALSVYLDNSSDIGGTRTAADEVDGFQQARENRFPEIDEAAEKLAIAFQDQRPASKRLQAAALVEEHLSALIGDIIDQAEGCTTAAARTRARRTLLSYATDAALMPSARFAAEATAVRYDVELLADIFSVEIPAVCRRLPALPQGADIPRFGYYLANASGAAIEMLALHGLVLPRYANGCPLWVLYRAQQSPETMIRQRALFPSGTRHVFVARARHAGPGGFGRPRHYLTDMIAMSEVDAASTVYNPGPDATIEEVGLTCRICPRRTCSHRVEDPLAG